MQIFDLILSSSASKSKKVRALLLLGIDHSFDGSRIRCEKWDGIEHESTFREALLNIKGSDVLDKTIELIADLDINAKVKYNAKKRVVFDFNLSPNESTKYARRRILISPERTPDEIYADCIVPVTEIKTVKETEKEMEKRKSESQDGQPSKKLKRSWKASAVKGGYIPDIEETVDVVRRIIPPPPISKDETEKVKEIMENNDQTLQDLADIAASAERSDENFQPVELSDIRHIKVTVYGENMPDVIAAFRKEFDIAIVETGADFILVKKTMDLFGKPVFGIPKVIVDTVKNLPKNSVQYENPKQVIEWLDNRTE